ncbi:MAG: hypothetical protein J5906_00420 [Acidaminococcaceae bacterium]|nr:hypothetical protein [Acidaminococcaceae bacterium]
MLVSLRKFFTEKGQGIVEYAVLLAFVIAIAAYLFSETGVKGEVSKTFSKTVSVLSSGNAQ